MIDLHKPQFENLQSMIERGVQTFLLVGDAGVGKKTLVRRVASKIPLSAFIEFDKFGIDEARSLKHQSLRKSPRPRLFLIDGDVVTGSAYNAMLKLLEEPPSSVIFVICASKPPLPTVVSRCNYMMLSPLNKDELKSVLYFRGMSERAAASVVPYAHGSVTEAFKVYEKLEEKRRLVPFIKALKNRDLTFVLQQVKTITRQDVLLMSELADDVLLSRYGLIEDEIGHLIPVSPDFLIQVRESLLEGSSPAIAWLRAYFNG